jgi:hypothetical protein
MGDSEGAIGARALGVHSPLRNDLSVKIGELFQEPYISLEHHRSTWPCSHYILVVGHRGTDIGGQLLLFICHCRSPLRFGFGAPTHFLFITLNNKA